MTPLTVTLVQEASTLEPGENRDLLRNHMERAAREHPGLVVFPEVFLRDFGRAGSDISAFAEDLEGPFVTTLVDLATLHGTTVVAGMFETSGDPARPYNTLVVADSSGVRASYRKIHLYDSFGYRESDRLTPGPLEPVTVDLAGLTVGVMTCYDLRFPELARQLVDKGADLLVVPAAWVAGPLKVDHWRTLTIARAVENTVYVAAAAQPEPRYTGHSMLVTPRGEVVAEARGGTEQVTGVVDPAVLEEARRENPSLANRRL